MPAKPWDNNGSPTVAESRLDELFGHGTQRGKQAENPPIPLDINAGSYDPAYEIRGAYLTRKLVETGDDGGWRPFGRRSSQSPVIRIEDAVITGLLDLRAADLPCLLQFLRCRFEQAPDLRQANLAGLMFSQCRFPGLRARNLSTGNDVEMLNCVSADGVINLTDARLGGSLEMTDSELRNPGKRAMHADRLTVAGAFLAMRLRVAGELRMPGANVGGNLNLSGATLRNRGRCALNASGVQIGGSLRGDVEPHGGRALSVAGHIYLASAHLAGDLRFRSAVLEPGISPPKPGESSHDDPTATLIADRSEIRGDVQLDQEFRSGGTIRMVSATIGGDLRMSRAQLDVSWTGTSPATLANPARTLHLDGTQILGNFDGEDLAARGQIRLTDVQVKGSMQLNRARLVGPRTDIVQANRIQVGSNLDCREAHISGTMQLQGAKVGANVDLRSTALIKPAWHRHRNTYKSSLDLRAASVGRDLVCAAGNRSFSAEGEVQLRRASVGRQTNFFGSELGEGSAVNAINAFGLVTQELSIRPKNPPRGRIVLRQAQSELLADNPALWQAEGGVDVEEFSYTNFSRAVDPVDEVRVRERLEWLRSGSGGSYRPGPYDQLASVFRENGNEEHAVTVLIEKQVRRYQAMAAATRPALRPSIRLWSFLQRITVCYGYRPIRALLWLLLFAGGGTWWFSFHELVPIAHEDRPVWNPFLYTVDQLVPIVNFGNDGVWRAEGASQWITVALITAGWILATTVATGINRSLYRDR